MLKQIAEEKAEHFNMRFMKGLGDGYMVIFENNDKALDFALNVTEAVTVHNSSAENKMQFDIRIGVDCGHVKMFDGNDRFGVCINRASRIEGLKIDSFKNKRRVKLPEKNRILVSYKVMRSVNRKNDFAFTLVGMAHLRGIEGEDNQIYLVTRPVK